MNRHVHLDRALVCIVLLASACATGAKKPASSIAGESCIVLAGTWEGTLAIHRDTPKSPGGRDEVTLRLVFAGDQPRVFLVDQEAWTEAKAGKFVARCLGPNAVVNAIDSARDSDGTWVETWVLAVTVRDPQELMARWVRMVNNVDLPLTNPSSKFGYEAVGVLRKTGAAPASKRCEDSSITIGEYLERCTSPK